MRVLITGGAGFIGRHLAAELARLPDVQLSILDNLSRATPAGLPPGSELRAGDIRDRDTVRSALEGIDVVYHLAAQSNVIGAVHDIDYSFSTNVVGTFELLRAAAEQGVRRFVFTSSREVYGDVASIPVREDAPMAPKNAYGASKAAGEAYADVFRRAGLPVTVLRLANVYGSGDRDRVIPIFLNNASAGRPLLLYGGEQVLDFVWIGTVVDVLLQAGFQAPVDGPINVGSGVGTPIRMLADRVLALTQSPSEIQIVPQRDVETRRFVADIGKAKAVFGLAGADEPLAHLVELLRTPKRPGQHPSLALTLQSISRSTASGSK